MLSGKLQLSGWVDKVAAETDEQVIFPFINQMLLDIGAAKSPQEVGYAAGLVEGIFSLTQLLTVFYWGTLSDRIGRKPVLIIGCIGSGASAVLLGFSRTFWQLIIFRCLNGAMNGNVAVLKSIVGEITDETNQSKAFSLFPLCLNIGALIAAFLGGTFAVPAKRFPGLTQTIPLLDRFPYLLPNLLSAIFPLLGAIVAALYFKETLKITAKDDDTDATTEDEIKYKDLFTPHINAIMVSFGLLSLMGTSVNAIVPLFCFTPIEIGGLGFSPTLIGRAMSARAVFTIIVQLLAFPTLQRRIGTIKMYKWLMLFWIPAFGGLPLTNAFARLQWNVAVWLCLGVSLMCGSIANMAFVCNLLMVNDASPSTRHLGAINGLSQAVMSGVRIFGPGGASVLFAVSAGKQILRGELIWIVYGLVSVLGFASALACKERVRLA